jgi:hypothetical protein
MGGMGISKIKMKTKSNLASAFQIHGQNFFKDSSLFILWNKFEKWQGKRALPNSGRCGSFHSERRLFTGVIMAALIAWKLVVATAKIIAAAAVTTNTTGLTEI